MIHISKTSGTMSQETVYKYGNLSIVSRKGKWNHITVVYDNSYITSICRRGESLSEVFELLREYIQDAMDLHNVNTIVQLSAKLKGMQ